MTMASPGRSDPEVDMPKVLGILKNGIFGKLKYQHNPKLGYKELRIQYL